MNQNGAKTWFFVDGYLPEKQGSGPLEAHEALMLLNANTIPANVVLDLYFDDKEPTKGITITVAPERVKGLRLDRPEDIGGVVIPPLNQYSIRVRSNVDIIAQFGRLDTTQVNLAYYSCAGYFASGEK